MCLCYVRRGEKNRQQKHDFIVILLKKNHIYVDQIHKKNKISLCKVYNENIFLLCIFCTLSYTQRKYVFILFNFYK